MTAGNRGLEDLSPFQLKDELIRYAKAESANTAVTDKFLNPGRGNPNWIATTPREVQNGKPEAAEESIHGKE